MNERLDAYSALLLEWNARLNLTAARDLPAIHAHIDDSLALVPYAIGPLIDVGSGGGFPALVLAIATGMAVTLLEPVRKKADFLARAASELDLANVRVLAQRAERAGHEASLREHFASATARAVGALPVVLELTVPFLAPGGRALLQRGAVDAAERAAAADAALVLGAEIAEEIPLAGQRRMVLARKMTPTPQRFPRRDGVPAKRPLCMAASHG